MRDKPPPLPELTEDEKIRTGHDVPFHKRFGMHYEEILFICRVCNMGWPPGAWEFSGGYCPECGSSTGAEKDPLPNAGRTDFV